MIEEDNQGLHSKRWQEYQDSHLITSDKSFDNIENLTEIASREAHHPENVQIAPKLMDSYDIKRIEEGEIRGHWYARYGSAPERKLIQKLAALEAGYAPQNGQIDGLVTDCGMSAISLTLDLIARSIPANKREGKRFLVGDSLYFMTKDVAGHYMKELGLEEAVYIDTTDHSQVKDALNQYKENIIGIFIEPVSNPLIKATNVREIARTSHEFGIPLIVDNTLLTPYGQQPFRLGADIVIHSLSKYMSGDGKTLGGAIIGPSEFIDRARIFRSMRGGVLSPESCHRIYEHLSDFPEEMIRYTVNGREIISYLRTVMQIEKINYTSNHQEMRQGSGPVFSICLSGETFVKKQDYERRFVAELVKTGGPIECKTSFGDGRYGALGQSTFGWEVPNDLKGVIRISAGLSDPDQAIRQLKNTFKKMYGGN